MKYRYIILLLLSSNLVLSQDNRLFENTWYLNKLVSNGIDNVPPTNSEVTSINLNFNQQNNSISTNACNSFSSEVVFGNNFTFSLKGGAATLRICFVQNNNFFESVYFDFLIENYPDNNFSYSIQENGTEKTLTINSSNNKQAIYLNRNLSKPEFKELYFEIYQDVSSNSILVKLKNQNTENVSLEIFDSLGKKHKSKSYKSDTINMELGDLSSGIYFVKIITDKGVGTKKFIKP